MNPASSHSNNILADLFWYKNCVCNPTYYEFRYYVCNSAVMSANRVSMQRSTSSDSFEKVFLTTLDLTL